MYRKDYAERVVTANFLVDFFLLSLNGYQLKQDFDPRVFFAAERTMLAWLRTGIATIGLGFLVARFGYFMMIVHGGESKDHLSSTLIGIGMVALGTTMIGLAGWQHGRFQNTLESESLPQRYVVRISLALTALMVACGIALAIYLANASRSTEANDGPELPVRRQLES